MLKQSLLLIVLIIIGDEKDHRAAEPAGSFTDARTCFQTNVPYDPRLAIAVDAVIVHRHGDKLDSLRGAISSWREKGYRVGRMFFADSDAANAYWTGKWDGTPHPGDVERNAKDEVVKCAGVRPYMLPTDGWIRYLEEMARQSIEAGAEAVLPEEPLAHVDTGYEQAFRDLWTARYGRPWQPESASAEARFLTAQLKNELYIELERRLAAATRARAVELGRRVPFVLPIHGLYSNVAAHLVAPLGTSIGIDGVDGYIGQVWTGPVNWALSHYDSPGKTFFDSAYVLYDYFAALVAGTGKKLWLLSDPVEDDPNHQWPEFEVWYRHCVVAELLQKEVDSYEVMPWPDRIFLPGYGTGGGTPAPERFRIAILSAIQALQEMPRGGEWLPPAPTAGIGVVVADTVLWEKEPFPPLQGIYGLFMPLVHAGVPVSACILERARQGNYLSRFQVLVLSYEFLKPLDGDVHRALATWVGDGGALIILGPAEDLAGPDFWWRKAGFPSPLHHLISTLGLPPELAERDGERSMGAGRIYRRVASPRKFGDPAAARAEYLALLDQALKERGNPDGLRMPGGFALKRGPFRIAHAGSAPLALAGSLIDVFDPELPLLDGARLEPGASGLYREVSDPPGGGPSGKAAPRILHATHRLISQSFADGTLKAVVRGPAETPAVLRVHRAGRQLGTIAARGVGGKELPLETRDDGPTLRIRFPNDPLGATLEIRWKD
jgi:hypothetical protein